LFVKKVFNGFFIYCIDSLMAEEKKYPDLNVAVVTSTKENTRDAGLEVAQKVLKELNKPPNLILLYATGNYEKSGGYQELLDRIFEVLPEETQLVGGNVPGFLNNSGCYAKGVTALAISYPNMEIYIGLGKNTKRNPKKAARQCANMIKKNAKNRYKNKLILSIISGPEIPGKQLSPIINSKFMAKTMPFLLSFMQKIFQVGFGGEEQILEELTKHLPEYNILHGSSVIGGTYDKTYQFCNKKVLRESVIGVVIETDLDYQLNSAHGSEKTDIKFTITKFNKNRTTIKKINNKPAYHEFLRLMGWKKSNIENERFGYLMNKNPLGFYKNNKIFMRPILMIMGEHLGCIGKIYDENITVTQITPSKMVDSVDELLTIKKPEFGFFVSCTARQSFLGIHVYDIQKKMNDYFNKKPYLLIYTGAEAIYTPKTGLEYYNETITSAVFTKK